MIRKAIETIIWIIAGAGVILLLSFSKKNHNQATCSDLSIHIDYPGSDTLLRPDQLRKLLQTQCGDFKGKTVNSLDFARINKVLGSLGQVVQTGAYSDMEGKLHIYVRQREPIMRLYTQSQKDYYADPDGILFRVASGNAGHVIIANGHIPDIETRGKSLISIDTLRNGELIRNIFLLYEKIQNNELLYPMIEQIYITDKQEVELIPKVGRQVILFGSFRDMEEKIIKLESFYRQGMMKEGWDKYKSINLKFKDQIVCSKM